MAIREKNKLDNIFHAIGELKLFTIIQFVAIGISSFPSAYQLLSNVFISRDVPHRCAAAPNGSTDHLSGLDDYQLEKLTISYQKCDILVSLNDTVLKKSHCIYGMEYDLPKDTSAVSQFDLVCDYKSLAKLTQTLVIAGQGIGATFFTMLSDRYGRKPIMVISNFGLGICGLIIAYAPNFLVFATFKFVIGGFQQGCVATIATMYLEMLTTDNRRIAAFARSMSWGVSAMSLAIWAYLLRDFSWRTLQMAVSLASLTFIIQQLFLKESLRWLIANGKDKAVKAYIQCATKLNKTSCPRSMKAYEDACHLRLIENKNQEAEASYDRGTATKKLTLLDLLKVKRLLLNATVVWLAWFTTALSFFAIYMMSTSLAGDPYLNYFLTSFMEIPNVFVVFFLLNRVGRKPTLVVIFFTVSTGLIAGGLFQTMEETPVTSAMAVVCSCIGMSGASAAFGFVFFYTPEIFPTNMRNQAVGVSSLMGRVGGMIAPFTGVLSEKAKWAPGIMIGCCSIVVCLTSIVLPETRGRELPQTIEDVKAWFYKKNDKDEENEMDSNDEEGSKIMAPENVNNYVSI